MKKSQLDNRTQRRCNDIYIDRTMFINFARTYFHRSCFTEQRVLQTTISYTQQRQRQQQQQQQ